MSSTGLNIIKMDGSIKLAQIILGQVDNTDCGADTIDFFNKRINRQFLKKLAGCKSVSLQEFDELLFSEFELTRGSLFSNPYQAAVKNLNTQHYSLNPWNGLEILDVIQQSNAGVPVLNGFELAADSISCAWAHVLDFDTGSFEVYQGYNEIALTEHDRFFSLQEQSQCLKTAGLYYPLRVKFILDMQNLTADKFKQYNKKVSLVKEDFQ